MMDMKQSLDLKLSLEMKTALDLKRVWTVKGQEYEIELLTLPSNEVLI